MRFTLAIGLALATPTFSVSAQRAPQALPAFQRRVLHSDSLDIGAVSVSRDGKWLAFDGSVRNRSSIWVVAATGGEIHRITDGAHDDLSPVWFPSGDRIAFSTNRVRGIVTVGFDGVRGVAVGPLKRISVEPTNSFDFSPDGTQLVYVVTPNADGRSRVRIAPSSGGAAKTIYDTTARLVHPQYSSDARTIYFTAWSTSSPGRVLMRVPATGGSASAVPSSHGLAVMGYPRIDRMVSSAERGLLVRSLAGDSIATVPIRRSPIDRGFSPDAQTLFQATNDIGAVVRVVQTANGSTVDLPSPVPSGYAYPYGWTNDNRLFYMADNDRTDSVYLGSIDRAKPRAFSLTPTNTVEGWKPTARIVPSSDGRSIFTRVVSDGKVGLYMFDLETRRVSLVSRNGVIANPTTTDWTSQKEFNFLEKSERGLELKSIRAGGQPTLVTALPSDASSTSVTVMPDRILYRKQAGDSTAILSASGTTRTGKLIATVAGSIGAIVASPDGRWLAAPAAVGSSAGGERRVMLLPLGENGLPSGPPRFVVADYMWDLSWTPDSRAVIGLEEEDMSARTRVRRIPVDPKEAPSTIGPTNTTFWDAYLSPDGKFVAIPVERPRGSTIWAFDLKALSSERR
jgi:Tol biopolymer transport system component